MRVMEKDFDNNKLMGDQLVIYGDWFSQPTRAVFIFAKMNGIPFEIKTLNFLNRDQQSKEFKLINPNGQMPGMKHGDFSLYESQAILKYLVWKFKLDDHWYPEKP